MGVCRGEIMTDMERILEDLREVPGIRGTLVASTSGSHIAGEPPESAHLETFTTMSAILLGAARTATKELDDTLDHVEVKLDNSRLMIFPAGDSAILVMEVSDDSDLSVVVEKGTIAGKKIGSIL